MSSETTTELPEALAEPVLRVRFGWMTLLFLANIALWLGIYAPIQVLLPEQAELLDKVGKETVLSIVMGAGALVALVVNPLVGQLSDRTCVRYGRRHPWTVVGAFVALGGLLVLAFAPNVGVMIGGWCLVQAGLNAMLATLMAAMPDRVPVAQRAHVGGLVGIAQMLGTVLGAILVGNLPGLAIAYLACGAIVLAGAAAFVLFTPDARLPVEYRPSADLLTITRGGLVRPTADGEPEAGLRLVAVGRQHRCGDIRRGLARRGADARRCDHRAFSS